MQMTQRNRDSAGLAAVDRKVDYEPWRKSWGRRLRREGPARPYSPAAGLAAATLKRASRRALITSIKVGTSERKMISRITLSK